MPTIHLHITGKVQGVFYRATAKKIADKLRLTGWIKNSNDNSVEAMASGHEDQLQEFIKWCWQGPENAKVDGVIVTNEKEIVFGDFHILRKQ